MFLWPTYSHAELCAFLSKVLLKVLATFLRSFLPRCFLLFLHTSGQVPCYFYYVLCILIHCYFLCTLYFLVPRTFFVQLVEQLLDAFLAFSLAQVLDSFVACFFLACILEQFVLFFPHTFFCNSLQPFLRSSLLVNCQLACKLS